MKSDTVNDRDRRRAFLPFLFCFSFFLLSLFFFSCLLGYSLPLLVLFGCWLLLSVLLVLLLQSFKPKFPFSLKDCCCRRMLPCWTADFGSVLRSRALFFFSVDQQLAYVGRCSRAGVGESRQVMAVSSLLAANCRLFSFNSSRVGISSRERRQLMGLMELGKLLFSSGDDGSSWSRSRTCRSCR